MYSSVKIFRDNVHGYIRVPVDFVELFIDTEIFQRLRNIEQTGMRVLYPSARHDRFIHSLGTYHLGYKAFDCFRENVKKSSDNQLDLERRHYHVFDNAENERFWDKCKVLFHIACLLHDCGHAPFSHTLEFYYEHFASPSLPLKDKLLRYLSSKEFKNDFNTQGTQHERMSALVVCAEFNSDIKNLLDKYKLNIDDDKDDVEFIARMIIGCKYQNKTKANQIKNCLIDLLNSKSIDVDKLDYIIRDSKLSGIDNMSVDVDRLLNSLTIIELTTFDKIPFNNSHIEANVKKNTHKIII